jgi:hypothetical protein
MSEDAQTRRREIAVEHVLFKLIEYVEQQQPGLLDFIENSLDHLGDNTSDATKNDEAVRDVARRMIAGARREIDPAYRQTRRSEEPGITPA